jgi:outer membrane lipoprotein-sorting protein
MLRKTLLSCVLLSLFVPLAANTQTTSAKLTAAQVVEKNVAARGGLQAWKSVQTMTWKGKMDAGTGDSAARSRELAQRQIGSGRMEHADMSSLAKPDSEKQVQLAFVADWKRGHKSRTEVEFAGKTAVQVYDGTNGWLYRPYLNREDVEPFTPEQLKTEANNADLDGYLIDYAAKGSKVDLEGVEKVEGHPAYKLKVTQKNGQVARVWVDAESFLDVKLSGTPKRMDGKMRDVYVYQRDFRTVQGVTIPFLLETAVDGYRDTHKMVIETVAINPKLDDALFTKAQVK